MLSRATGGTPRHSLAIEHAIRPLFAYLRAASVPTGVYAATEDWGQGADAVDGSLVERIERAATELSAVMAAAARRSAATLRRSGPVRGAAPRVAAIGRLRLAEPAGGDGREYATPVTSYSTRKPPTARESTRIRGSSDRRWHPRPP